jgi:hypothetical protein
MAKIAKALFLDESAVARGEQYSADHNTNLSQIVSDLLNRLPVERAPRRALALATSRLLGAAAGSALGRDAHRTRLRIKNGVRWSRWRVYWAHDSFARRPPNIGGAGVTTLPAPDLAR